MTIVSLVTLLLSGCNYPFKETDQSNIPTKMPQMILSGEITDAEFAIKGKSIWIAVNAINQGSPYTEILHSSDNGQIWSATNEKNLYILSMQFVDNEHGWAIGNVDPQSADKVYYILSTKDGGKSWSKQYQTEQTSRISPCQIQFLNLKEGFARFNNLLLSTTDGGESWKQTNSIDNLMSFDFRDNKEGWASNLDSIWHTFDGGNNWVKEWDIPTDIEKRIEPVTSKIIVNPVLGGWVVFAGQSTMSQSSKIILNRDQSANWTIENGYYMAEPRFPGNTAPYENGDDLLPVSDTNAFFVAYIPTTYPFVVLKTNDQGKTWSKIVENRPNGFPVMLPGDFARIYFANEQLGWAIVINRSTANNTLNVVKTEDGGHVWKTVMKK